MHFCIHPRKGNQMRNLITTTTAVLVLSASSALAWNDTNNNNRNTNLNSNTAIAGAVAAQHQGQDQRQNQRQGQDQGQSQSADNHNNINMEGSVSGQVSCDQGVTVGAVGLGVLGGCWSTRSQNVIAEATALNSFGRPDLAVSHMTQIPRVAETVNASTTVRAATPIAVAYSFCGEVDGVFTVRVPVGGDAALASAQCMATR
jgi:hypothetical protein